MVGPTISRYISSSTVFSRANSSRISSRHLWARWRSMGYMAPVKTWPSGRRAIRAPKMSHLTRVFEADRSVTFKTRASPRAQAKTAAPPPLPPALEDGVTHEPLADVDLQHPLRARRQGVKSVEVFLMGAAEIRFADRVIYLLFVFRLEPCDGRGRRCELLARQRSCRPVFVEAAFLVLQPAAARARIVSTDLVHRITDLLREPVRGSPSG